MTPAERIQEALDWAKLKPAHLAKQIGVTDSAVYQWLSSDTKAPTAENIFAIADATGYSARWLATEKGIKRAPKALSVLEGGKSDSPSKVNPDVLGDAIAFVEQLLTGIGKVYPPRKKADMIMLAYDIILKGGRPDADTMKGMLQLVS